MSGTLIDRATTTKLLYNYLEYVSPADVDGIKKAYVEVGDKKIKVKPIAANDSAIADMYGANGGKKPTIIADNMDPMALIAKASPDDELYPVYRGFGNELLRSALRRIVDEV